MLIALAWRNLWRRPQRTVLSLVSITLVTSLMIFMLSFQLSVYELMKLLGHESIATSQRYVSAAGTETRAAAAQNPLYNLIALKNSDQNGRSDKRRVTARSPVHATAPQ